MKRLRVIAIVVAGLLLVWIVICLKGPKEPSYQGKTLLEWRAEFGQTHIGVRNAARIDPKTVPSLYAIRQIGTNAFPFLLHELAAKDSPLKAKVASLVNGLKWQHLRVREADLRRVRAATTFALLNDLAQPIVPDLIKLTKDKDAGIRQISLLVLLNINPGRQILVPVLLRLIHDEDKLVREDAAMDLHDLFPEEARKVNLSQLFPGSFDDLTNNTPTDSPAAK